MSEVIISPSRPDRIAIGSTGEICEISESRVIKHPRSYPGGTAYNELRLTLMDTERRIYERLGYHEGILPYFGSCAAGAIELAYAKQGDLETYIKTCSPPPKALRRAWIRILMRAFHHIYSRRVLHQDVKVDNILIDYDSPKVADFANGSIFPLDADMATICAQDPLSRVDIMGIGSVIYSIAAWNVYTFDYFEEERWPWPDEVPNTDGIDYQEIIEKCWRNEYDNIQLLFDDFQSKDHEMPRAEFMMWFCIVPSLMFVSGYCLSVGACGSGFRVF